MAFKQVATVLAAAMVLLARGATSQQQHHDLEVEDSDPHPAYSYSYGVEDGLTGDSKTHTETREGGVVRGRYSLLEADGTRRIVEYVADPVHGFRAAVKHEPAASAGGGHLPPPAASPPPGYIGYQYSNDYHY